MNQIEYLLTCLAEECTEVAQRATKAQRFGVNEVQPDQDLNNAERIMVETQEFRAILRMLEAHGVLDTREDEAAITAKIEKVEKFMGYSIQEGTLDSFTPYRDLIKNNNNIPSSKFSDTQD